ncbi:MAG: hypothetical protein PHS41_06185 [Victivallaceae bacterium]|nr:hypothetical protein [Victivallaceae bacterium]
MRFVWLKKNCAVFLSVLLLGMSFLHTLCHESAHREDGVPERLKALTQMLATQPGFLAEENAPHAQKLEIFCPICAGLMHLLPRSGTLELPSFPTSDRPSFLPVAKRPSATHQLPQGRAPPGLFSHLN